MCLINVKLDPAVTVKYRTAIKVLLLYFNLHLSVKLDSLSCSFTTISFLTNGLSWTLHILHIIFFITGIDIMHLKKKKDMHWHELLLLFFHSPRQHCFLTLKMTTSFEINFDNQPIIKEQKSWILILMIPDDKI
jgi:hypothetical protein